MGGEDPVLVGKGALTVGTLTKHVVITNNMGCYGKVANIDIVKNSFFFTNSASMPFSKGPGT